MLLPLLIFRQSLFVFQYYVFMYMDDLKDRIPAYLHHSRTYSVIVTDLHGHYVYVNAAFKKKFSFISEAFEGLSALTAIYPEDHQVCLEAVQRCLNNPDDIVPVYLRKPAPNGEDFYWTAWEFSVLKDRDQQPSGILCIGHDITESERASRRAKEFAAKIETIIGEMTDGFYQLDREWRFVKINRTAEQILGISKAQLIGQVLWDYFPDTPLYNYPAQFRKAMDESLTVTFEDYRPDIDRWFSAVVYPSIEGINVFFRDITTEYQNRLALKLSENKLKAILDSTTESNLLISPTHRILNFNKTANELAKSFFLHELALDMDIRQILPSESLKIYEAYFPKALQGEKHVLEIQRQMENEWIWFETSYIPVYDSDHIQIGVTINSKHINDRKQAELKVREKEHMLKAIYHSTTEASSFIDKDFVIRYNNQVAQQITSAIFGRAAQAGDHSLDFVLPEYQAEFAQLYQRVLAGEKIVIERSHAHQWWQFAMWPVYDEYKKIIGIAHNVQDITEQKNNQHKIIHQNELLKAIAWQQSHELRRPVAQILGICDLLQNYENETEEMKRRYIGYLIEVTQELDRIIHQIVRQTNASEYSP